MAEYRASSGALVFVPTAEMERQFNQRCTDLHNSKKLEKELKDVAKMKEELAEMLAKMKEPTT